MRKHVCPWWFAYTFDNPLRRIFHKPENIFSHYLKEGMTAIDIGCGMGYFSIAMAKIVGEAGKIISVDLQQKMLDTLEKRAKEAGVSNRITSVLCDEKDIGIDEEVDFALTFWMLHETPDESLLLQQVHSILKKSGKLLLAEPKLHVSLASYKKSLATAKELGFKVIDEPFIWFSYAAILEKSE